MTTINSVCIVCNGSIPKFTDHHKYVINSVLEVFGNDIGKIITILFTFSDGSKINILSAFKREKIPFQEYF
jgi:hypothetical protein